MMGNTIKKMDGNRKEDKVERNQDMELRNIKTRYESNERKYG